MRRRQQQQQRSLLFLFACIALASAQSLHMPLLCYDSGRATLLSAAASGGEQTPWLASTTRVLGAQLLQGGAALALHTYNTLDASDSLCEYSTRDGRLVRCVVQVHGSTLDPDAAQQHFVVLEAPVVRTNASQQQQQRSTHHSHPAPPPVLLYYSQAGQTLMAYSWRDGSFEGVVNHGALRALVAVDNSTLAWLTGTDQVALVNATLDSAESLQQWTFTTRWRIAMPSPEHLALRRDELVVFCEQPDGTSAALWMHTQNGTALGSAQFPLRDVRSAQALDDGTFVLLQPSLGVVTRYEPWPAERAHPLGGARGSVLLSSLNGQDFWLLGAQVARVFLQPSLALSTRAGSSHASGTAQWPLTLHGNVLVAEHAALSDCSHELVLQDGSSLVRYSLDVRGAANNNNNLFVAQQALVDSAAHLVLADAHDECTAPVYYLLYNDTHLGEQTRASESLPSTSAFASLPCRVRELLYCGTKKHRRACLLCADSGSADQVLVYVATPHAAGYVLQPYTNTLPSLSLTLVGSVYDERRDALALVHYDGAQLHIVRLEFAADPSALAEWSTASVASLPSALSAFLPLGSLACDDGALLVRVNSSHLVRENNGHARWTLLKRETTATRVRSVRRVFLTLGYTPNRWHWLASLVVVCCMVSPLCALLACLCVYQARTHGAGAGLRRLRNYVPYTAAHRQRAVVWAIDATRRVYTLVFCCAPALVHWLDAHTVGEHHARMQDQQESALPEDQRFAQIFGAVDDTVTVVHRRRGAGTPPAVGSGSRLGMPYPGRSMDDVELQH